MIEEIKIEGIDTLCHAIKDAIDSAGVDTTGATAGQVLTATEDETTHEISATWEDPAKELPKITAGDNGKKLQAVYDNGATSVQWVNDQGASYTFDNSVHTQIGQYNEHSGDTVSVYPIKTAVCSPTSDIYLGNGSGSFEANIGDNAEIISCDLVAKDGYTLYRIPCITAHATGTLPANISYNATWNGTNMPSNGGSAKFFVTYIEKDNL